MISVLPLVAVFGVWMAGIAGLSAHTRPPQEQRLLAKAKVSTKAPMSDKQKPKEEGPRRATKVPGGWKLPGDPTLYPYDPTVPPDQANPRPPRTDRPGFPQPRK